METAQRTLRRMLVLVGIVLPVASIGLVGTPASASPALTTLTGSQPGWVSGARPIGWVPAGASIWIRVYLAPRTGEAALRAAVAAVSTPGSSRYRQFITPARYRATYGPSASSVAAVRGWLVGSGMDVARTTEGGRFVAASGTVGAAERAFGVTLKRFRIAGHTRFAPSTDASVPSAIAADILGITGLSTPSVMAPDSIAPPPGFRDARPCSSWYGQIKAKRQEDFSTPLPRFKGTYRPYVVCGSIPSQFRQAYGVDETQLTGKGTTVGIIDAYSSHTILSDANTYAKRHGDSPFQTGQFITSRPGSPPRLQRYCAPSTWLAEETLDVEAVHGIAVDANVIDYESRSCFDVDLTDAMARALDENQASIVASSWGGPDYFETSGEIAAYEQVFLQGALQGIGFLFSSGDWGDDLQYFEHMGTDYPASDPYATSVGGTSMGLGYGSGVVFQTGWGTDFWDLSEDGSSWVASDPSFGYGSGGGFSTVFNRPDYQNGVVPPKSPAGRAVPDVALDGDPDTGMLIGETQSFPDGVYYDEYRVGGTSLASQQMAGMQALATEHAGERLGFANPAIYALAGGDDAGDFIDVLADHGANVRIDYVDGVDPSDGYLYRVRTFDQDSSLRTTPGWDAVTGIGVPDPGYLLAFGG